MYARCDKEGQAAPMLQRILIPLDGSPLAEWVLPYLPHLLPPRVELCLLQVISPLPPEPVAGRNVTEWPTPVPPRAEVARQYLNGVRETSLADYGSVSVVVLEGKPVETIVEAAREQGTDLIAMATHGASGLALWTMGSVAEGVMQRASCPVLLVRVTENALPPRPLKRILVPLDGSPVAEQALPHAVALAKEKQAELILLRTVDPLTEHEMRAIVRYRKERDVLIEQFRQEATHYLTPHQQALEREGLQCRQRVIAAHAGEGILHVAAKEEADLIVMTTHGRSGIGKLVYGSVTDHVLHHATRPLLVVRARRDEAD
jgi:nucleotide-binding universal stress UspA family protein